MIPYDIIRRRTTLITGSLDSETLSRGLIASTQTVINTPVAEVWDALVNPEKIKLYMFGTEVVSEWKEGAAIEWRGVWEGKPYSDRGKILELNPPRTISYSHFSPLSGLPEVPENYHEVRVELADDGGRTVVSLSQDNNPTEEARLHSEENWAAMLTGLKSLLETKGGSPHP